jgi:hypothetical protein
VTFSQLRGERSRARGVGRDLAIALPGLFALGSFVAGCRPAHAPVRPEPRVVVATPAPTPSPTPAVLDRLGEPLVEPSAPVRDVVRASLEERIGPTTPPRIAEALRMGDRARAELEAGTTVQAFELLDMAIDMEPEVMELYVIRAHAFLAEGSAAQARADLERAASLHPDRPWLAEIVAVHGSCHEVEGRVDQALAAYRRAVRVYPPNGTAREGLRRLAVP